MKLSKLAIATALSVGFAAPLVASADSDIQYGAGATATANLDFRITIDQFVYFQVGSAGTTDRVDWDLTGTQAGQSAVPIGATGGTGDGADGVLGVTLTTNAATVTLSSNTGGGNLTGPTDTIPFADINVSDGGTITAPDFDASTGPIVTGANYSETDNWTFTYNDDTVYAPGEYNGTSTYTAATP